MKILVAPDKFKGSLTTFEACSSIQKGFESTTASVLSFPMADGGDGFAAVLQHYLQTETVPCTAKDPLGRSLEAGYQWKEETAIIELAVASGLVLLAPHDRNPMHTSTLGTGLMIRHAVDKGARTIILGLGGSATNDGGTGILSALGFRFLDKDQQPLAPCGKNLMHIVDIAIPQNLPSVSFEIACDVQNPMHGSDGAALIYGPQKGATAEEVAKLDAGLKNLAVLLNRKTGKQIDTIPGTGAAGGIAAGLMAFFDVRMRKGIDLVLEASGMEQALQDADLVITGEGKLDGQSGSGKVVAGVAALASKYGIPVVALCGQRDIPEASLKSMGITAAFSIVNGPMTLEQASRNAQTLLQETAQQVAQLHAAVWEKRSTPLFQ